MLQLHAETTLVINDSTKSCTHNKGTYENKTKTHIIIKLINVRREYRRRAAVYLQRRALFPDLPKVNKNHNDDCIQYFFAEFICLRKS